MKLLLISERIPSDKYTSLFLEDITDFNDNELKILIEAYLVGSYHLVSDSGERFSVDKDLTKILDTIKETYWSTTFKDTGKKEITFRIMSAEITSVKLKMK